MTSKATVLPSDALEIAEGEAFTSMYRDLERIARYQISHEAFGYRWSPHALINEAYIRIVRAYGKEWIRRSQLIPLWRRVIRNVLIDEARALRSAKRNQAQTLELTDLRMTSRTNLELGVSVAIALHKLAKVNPREALTVQLRFAEGRTEDEIGRALRVSTRTVKRVMRSARAHLEPELQ